MDAGSKKILVVEDDANLLRLLVDALRKEGFQVLEAHDGEEALRIAFEEHPDLMLLDIVMPKLDGLTALKRLREDEWGKGAAVIILTNLSDAEKVSSAMGSNVFDFLVKESWKLQDVVAKAKERLAD